MRMVRLVLAGLLVTAPAAGQRPDPQREAQSMVRACLVPQGKEWCEINLKKFTEEYPKALRGDYQSQRNVAYLLSGAWQPAIENPVQTNTLQACAWRLVILQSGHAQAGPGDVSNRDIDCRRPGVDRPAAEARAAELLRRIRAAPPFRPPVEQPTRRRGPLDGEARPLTPN